MSLKNQIGRVGETSVLRRAARLVLCAGLATSLAGALSLGSAAAASAAPVGPLSVTAATNAPTAPARAIRDLADAGRLNKGWEMSVMIVESFEGAQRASPHE